MCIWCCHMWSNFGNLIKNLKRLRRIKFFTYAYVRYLKYFLVARNNYLVFRKNASHKTANIDKWYSYVKNCNCIKFMAVGCKKSPSCFQHSSCLKLIAHLPRSGFSLLFLLFQQQLWLPLSQRIPMMSPNWLFLAEVLRLDCSPKMVIKLINRKHTVTIWKPF